MVLRLMPFPSPPAECKDPNPHWSKLTHLHRLRSCCTGFLAERTWSVGHVAVEVKKASGLWTRYMGRGWHLLGGPQDANAFSHFAALSQMGHPFCTAEILLKPGALQNRGLNQECNAKAVNQVKHAKLRKIKVEQSHKLYIDH